MALFQLDFKIHQLQREIENAGATPQAWLATKYDTLSDLYFDKSQVTQERDDVERAQTLGRTAIEFGSYAASDTRLPNEQSGQWWTLQASRLQKQYLRFNEAKDLDCAITAFDNAIRDLPATSELRREALLNQANYLSTRFDIAGDAADMERAIYNFNILIEAGSGTSIVHMPLIYNNMSINYRSRFEQLRGVEDLKQAERYATLAAELTEDDNTNLPTRLLNLAVCRCMLFEEDGQIKHVNNALQDLEKAATLSRIWNLECLPQVLSEQVGTLYLRYQDQEDAADIQHAITLAKEVLAAIPFEDVENTRSDMEGQLALFLSEVDKKGPVV